jgi:hypothetical protein
MATAGDTDGAMEATGLDITTDTGMVTMQEVVIIQDIIPLMTMDIAIIMAREETVPEVQMEVMQQVLLPAVIGLQVTMIST